MKKVSVDIMLGRKTHSHFHRPSQKSLTVVAQMPVGTATKSSSYGLRFGKTGLNTIEICETFNTANKELWKQELILPIVITLSPTKTYTMETKFPTVYTLLDVIFSLASKEMKKLRLPIHKEVWLKLIYKLAVIKTQALDKKTIMKAMSEICGTIYSCDLYNPWRKEKKGFNYKKKNKK